MSTGIHLHIEAKIQGVWHHYAAPGLGRYSGDYNLFCKMAGVRGPRFDRKKRPIIPISAPRGLPPDVTSLTLFARECWAVDGHSVSWLSSKEVFELERWGTEDMRYRGSCMTRGFWSDEAFGYFFGNSYEGWLKYPEDLAIERRMGLEDFRFVFWFDC
jgi:hypothetical protein